MDDYDNHVKGPEDSASHNYTNVFQWQYPEGMQFLNIALDDISMTQWLNDQIISRNELNHVSAVDHFIDVFILFSHQ